jgi:hypothetical protein
LEAVQPISDTVRTPARRNKDASHAELRIDCSFRVVRDLMSRAQDRQSAESLLLTLEAVLEEVQRMLQAVSGTPEPRFR